MLMMMINALFAVAKISHLSKIVSNQLVNCSICCFSFYANMSMKGVNLYITWSNQSIQQSVNASNHQFNTYSTIYNQFYAYINMWNFSILQFLNFLSKIIIICINSLNFWKINLYFFNWIMQKMYDFLHLSCG